MTRIFSSKKNTVITKNTTITYSATCQRFICYTYRHDFIEGKHHGTYYTFDDNPLRTNEINLRPKGIDNEQNRGNTQNDEIGSQNQGAIALRPGKMLPSTARPMTPTVPPVSTFIWISRGARRNSSPDLYPPLVSLSYPLEMFRSFLLCCK